MSKTASQTFTLHTDGGSRGNPGPSGIGFVLERGSVEVANGGAFIGTTTNNVAEYEALIWGLENALALGARRVEMIADSELMVRQVTGVYKVKNEALKALASRVQALLGELESWSFEHTLREANSEADALVNQALDARDATGDPASAWTPTPRTLFDDAEGADSAADVNAGASPAEPQKEPTMPPATYRQAPSELSRAAQSSSAQGTYYLTVKDHFDAAHRLYDYPGPCRELHGHTWDIEVTVSARKLDEIGIVYDFKTLKDDLHTVLETYDHHYLNETAPFDTISPTAENLARVIYERLREVVDPRVRIAEVVVWESPIARLAYQADDAR
ncbi:MAG: 6-carboxytetrahydropterin synthase QueD [Actinomycetia bacterium]|nr:6-carboxytetrahydropterin synthase QueD [Actinomycetes bacterium]